MCGKDDFDTCTFDSSDELEQHWFELEGDWQVVEGGD